MSRPRPPSAVVLTVTLLAALACQHSVGTEPNEPALAPEPPRPAVSAPPPGTIAVLPEPEPVLPEPEVTLPEITTVALARQVLASEARALDEEQREQVARVIADAEQELGLEAMLVLAVITQESRFDPRAVGPRGSLGLMQIRPFVAEDVARRHGLPWAGDATLLDPAHNVRIGTLYLAELFEMFGEDAQLTLAAYNMGPYRMRRLLREGRQPRSAFPGRVFEHYDGLVLRYGRSETAWGG